MTDHIRSEELAAYVDGLLSAAGRSAVENHIAGCPECLGELAEVTAFLENREKIPARFLEPVLGVKNKASRSILPLRLVFEVAAVVVVVVFIGYLFLSNNRFWQVPEQKKPAEVAARKDIQLGAPADTAGRESEIDAARQNRRRAAAAEAGRSVQLAESEGKMKITLDQAADEKFRDERSALKKMPTQAADKGTPASPAAAAEAAPQKEAAATPTAVGAVGGVAQDFTADGQAVARTAKGKAAPLLPVRVEGEASLSDLRNPELLSDWSWLRQGLALVLGINGAGNVIEVVLEGNFASSDAKLAEAEARKLFFSVSGKKLRHARLVAERRPPN